MVEAASSRRSSIPWRIPRAKISVASARDGEDGDQSSYALGGSQQGGVSPTSKVFVLRQVAQALAYLHSQSPPLVHHDLSPNNVLLDVVSLVTKVSDFGMSRVINPSALSRKSSVKGTVAFMAPEALHDPPRYNEKLDVFSFGNIITFTLSHVWPSPGPPT